MDESLQNKLSADRLQSRQVDELIGLGRGLIADGAINEAEVHFLYSWLAANTVIAQQPLIATLYDRVQEILGDGTADADECADLLEALRRFTANEFEAGEQMKATTLPLCDPAPSIRFEGHLFCFTGTFNFGQRRHCEEEVTVRGGEAGSLTKKTDFLVIGSYATEAWKHSSYGNKIIRAVEMRSSGVPISIISEQHWKAHL